MKRLQKLVEKYEGLIDKLKLDYEKKISNIVEENYLLKTENISLQKKLEEFMGSVGYQTVQTTKNYIVSRGFSFYALR